MIKEVELLKNRKESERKQFVDQQMDRHFHENTDDLRKLNSEFKNLQTVHHRNI